MREYIQAGPACLDRTLKALEDPILEIADDVKNGRFERIILSGIGSSYTASVMAAPLFTWYSPVPVHVIDSWEFTTLPTQLVNEKTLVVAISR
jgi:fructoselysine-6-P-deglycase FrlB-like protein